ncbi:hypothetical protein SAMN05216389_10377 [Oceanobacillus limi]|uniref:Uncharacterized protein n=1 Tax=Oceanobacillus limi TaxID=930131 RepID=A0A1I0A561_9BACI|nr:hypothetical protein SAMN05216389_10377 [Oceanobacillus limi]
MKRIRCSWQCPKCNHRSNAAHRPAIGDCFLIFSSSITSKLGKWFLCVQSRYVVKRIFQKENLVYDSKKMGSEGTVLMFPFKRNLPNEYMND